MSVEIERKYLLKDPNWRPKGTADHLVQGYFWLGENATLHVLASKRSFSLVLKPRDGETFTLRIPSQDGAELLALHPHYFSSDWTCRVRSSSQEGGFLTIKGPTLGISCPEYEYALKPLQTRKLLKLCESTHIHKDRYKKKYQGFTWEIDVFGGHLADENLVICEIELPHKDVNPILPEWVGVEVSTEKAYKNAWMARRRPLPIRQY